LRVIPFLFSLEELGLFEPGLPNLFLEFFGRGWSLAALSCPVICFGRRPPLLGFFLPFESRSHQRFSYPFFFSFSSRSLKRFLSYCLPFRWPPRTGLLSKCMSASLSLLSSFDVSSLSVGSMLRAVSTFPPPTCVTEYVHDRRLVFAPFSQAIPFFVCSALGSWPASKPWTSSLFLPTQVPCWQLFLNFFLAFWGE